MSIVKDKNDLEYMSRIKNAEILKSKFAEDCELFVIASMPSSCTYSVKKNIKGLWTASFGKNGNGYCENYDGYMSRDDAVIGLAKLLAINSPIFPLTTNTTVQKRRMDKEVA